MDANSLLRSRISLVWLLLVGATLLSWQLGHGAVLTGRALPGVAILVLAFVKARFVIIEFMELRQAPRAMRIVAEGWPLLACVLLVSLYLRAAS